MNAQHVFTPALRTVSEAGLWHRVYDYQHDDAVKGFGVEAADKLDVDPKRIFKTLLVSTPQGNLANAILAVADMLSLRRTAKVLGVKKVTMAPAALVEKKTGYVLGGVSPLGQKLCCQWLSIVLPQKTRLYWFQLVNAESRWSWASRIF